MLKNIPPMLPKEKQATASVEELVLGNLKLVVHMAKMFSCEFPSIADDLIQEGYIGLQRAAERYDGSRGVTFGTYASYWIRQRIYRYLELNRSIIKIPCHHFDKNRRKGRYSRQAQEAMTGIFSIDNYKNNGEDFDIPEELSETKENEELNTIINDLMQEVLSDRERIILTERFNLDDKNDVKPTLDVLGMRFNLTRERIRQIEFSALKKLRKKLELTKYNKIFS